MEELKSRHELLARAQCNSNVFDPIRFFSHVIRHPPSIPKYNTFVFFSTTFFSPLEPTTMMEFNEFALQMRLKVKQEHHRRFLHTLVRLFTLYSDRFSSHSYFPCQFIDVNLIDIDSTEWMCWVLETPPARVPQYCGSECEKIRFWAGWQWRLPRTRIGGFLHREMTMEAQQFNVHLNVERKAGKLRIRHVDVHLKCELKRKDLVAASAPWGTQDGRIQNEYV